MDFDKILFMHWYIWSMLWLIHIIFPNFSTELWPLIDFRIMFMLNILWNNWWIWSNLIFFLCQNMCIKKHKHSGGVSCSACNAFIFFWPSFLWLLLKGGTVIWQKANHTDHSNPKIDWQTHLHVSNHALNGISLHSDGFEFAPNLEEVDGAYWFRVVHPSVRQEPCMLGFWNFIYEFLMEK